MNLITIKKSEVCDDIFQNGQAMIKSSLANVTLIIGAGAHVPYDFPTGEELKTTILNLNLHARTVNAESSVEMYADEFKKYKFMKRKVCQLIIESKYFESQLANRNLIQLVNDKVRNFIERFAQSHNITIDYFISRNGAPEEDQFLGKILIGTVLSYYESETRMGYQSYNWIQELINKYIRNDCNNFFNHPPNIVTFNYDRLFEQYLITHLVSHHHKTATEAIDLINSLPIIHVYGSLGKCNSTSFSEFTHERVNDIDVVRGQKNTKIEKRISEALWKSEKIYVLGFGFDDHNTSLLFSQLSNGMRKKPSEQKQIICSCFNLSNREMGKLELMFPSQIKIDWKENEDIYTIISKSEPLDSPFIKPRKATVVVPNEFE